MLHHYAEEMIRDYCPCMRPDSWRRISARDGVKLDIVAGIGGRFLTGQSDDQFHNKLKQKHVGDV